MEKRMPITSECLTLLRKFADSYQIKGQDEDQNYTDICFILNNLLLDIANNPKDYTDDRVNGCLTSSALLLGGENTLFADCCRDYLRNFQSKTQALDSFFDLQLNLDTKLFIRSKESEVIHSSSAISPFFLELQQALQRRAERMEIQALLNPIKPR